MAASLIDTPTADTHPTLSDAELRALAPRGQQRMGANPHTNGGPLSGPLDLPDFRSYGVDVPEPAQATHEATRVLGEWLRDVAHLRVRGYKEERTTTTPFDMVMLNDLDRFHLVIAVIDRVPGLAEQAAHLRQRMVDERLRHRAYTRAVGDDPPDVRNWIWPTHVGSGQGQAAISRNGAHN
jgi:phosphoketolase